jgi:hypothetical protein
MRNLLFNVGFEVLTFQYLLYQEVYTNNEGFVAMENCLSLWLRVFLIGKLFMDTIIC